jgi:hypothetical protein
VPDGALAFPRSAPDGSDPHGRDIGIQPHIIEQILNHQSGHKAGVAGVYNRSAYIREIKNALAVWADHVVSIVSGEERKILQFPASSETG